MVKTLLMKLTEFVRESRAMAIIETETRQLIDNFTTEEVSNIVRLVMKDKNKKKKKSKRVLIICGCSNHLTVKETVNIKKLSYFDKTKDIILFQDKKACSKCKHLIHYIFFDGLDS